MGLAKELNDSYKPDKDGLYNLTGMTGSPRYMVSITSIRRDNVKVHMSWQLPHLVFPFTHTRPLKSGTDSHTTCLVMFTHSVSYFGKCIPIRFPLRSIP
jgi:hypothetical protein